MSLVSPVTLKEARFRIRHTAKEKHKLCHDGIKSMYWVMCAMLKQARFQIRHAARESSLMCAIECI